MGTICTCTSLIYVEGKIQSQVKPEFPLFAMSNQGYKTKKFLKQAQH